MNFLLFPFGHDFWGFYRKNLLYNLVGRNLKLRYRQSYLGVVWTILVPALSAAVYFGVFQFVMKVSLPNYLLFLLSGILPWTFFSTAVVQSMESIVGNHTLINKVPIPPSVFPLVETITAFANLVFSLPILILVAVATSAPVTFWWLLIPVYIGLLLLQAYGIGLLCALVFVYFRDLRHLMMIVMQVWFYVTPILYTSEMIPTGYEFLLKINPVAYLFEGFHLVLVYGQPLSAEKTGIAFLWTALCLVLPFYVYKRNGTLVAESL